MKIKILYIIPTLELGGAEILLINHINLLDYNKYEPSLMIVGEKYSLINQLSNKVNIINIDANKRNYLFKIPLMITILKTLKPSVIHSHLFKANLLARFFKLFSNQSIVINHYHGLSDWIDIFRLNLDRITQNLMDHAIVVSTKSFDLRLKRERINKNKIKLIYNFVNKFPENLDPKTNKNSVTLGMACRLIPLKNIPAVISLVKFLNNNGFEVYLKIAGDGPEKQKINNLIIENDLKSKITVLGFCTDLNDFYKDIDVYIIASETEDFPLSISEAMSYGCSIISSDVGGIKNVIDRTEGLVVSKIDKSSYNLIANYLKKLNLKQAFQINREFAKNKFHKDIFLLKIKKLYEGR